ncbi:MAG: Fatty acid desaturase [Mycobacterium sp.]|nr:Fatty acid desaturase [Mycobacterium sp.]
MTPDQKWKPENLAQLLRSLLLAITFEWGIALHDLYSEQERTAVDVAKSVHGRALLRKIGRQTGKDYLLWPASSRRRWRRTLGENVSPPTCSETSVVGTSPTDGAEKFTPDTLKDETKPEWFLRQMLGSANFDAGPVLAFMTGNLCYQIEHHLFPDLPSNRYAEIAQRVRALRVAYDLPYTTGHLVRQYLTTVRTVCANWHCRTGRSQHRRQLRLVIA